MSFKKFSQLVHARFNTLSKHELFIVGNPPPPAAEGEEREQHPFVAAYLASFPEGTDPIYKTRTEHDCSCCKNFVKNIGNLIAIVDGKMETVWDIEGAPAPYNVVAKAMADFTRKHSITGVFRTKERSYGAEETLQNVEGSIKRWNHFHGKVADRHRTDSPAEAKGDFSAGIQVFYRGLDTLKEDAFETVISLIEQGALYRGEEHLKTIKAFQKAQKEYLSMSEGQRSFFVWSNALAPYARFRNTVIGTLIQDLSEGVDLEQAVRSFEVKVAPQNYKRPTSLITPAMVKQAMAKIEELGLEPSLHRRFARASDVSVNNVLWVNNTTKGKMKGGIADLLMDAATTKVAPSDKAKDISIDEFMSTILPQASEVEIMLTGAHLPNFVSLTAPQHEDSKRLFKWKNDFAWSYDGNITDSIKEKVKKAGGNVTNAKLRVSLAWFNYDDLDIHVIEPNGSHIYFRDKQGKLDVDMNAGGGRTRKPVENVSWTPNGPGKLKDGIYKVFVNQFAQRETTDVGCVIEVENEGRITQLSYPKVLKGDVDFCTIEIVNGAIAKLTPAKGITGTGISQEKWGVKTETAVKVNMVMYSPNHWDGNSVGNRHWFFILEGCKNPDATRGIYNEFLSSELDQHRKVFEVLGDKTKCQPTDDQLSGLGFSSTRNDVVTMRVSGEKINRTFNVSFAKPTLKKEEVQEPELVIA